MSKFKHGGICRAKSYRDDGDRYAFVDVVVSTGAPVYREERDGNGGVMSYVRELEISEKAIRMERLLSGCPVLNNHKEDGSVGDLVGCVHDAWIEKTDDGKSVLMATLKLSKVTERDREVTEKVKDGIITGVSVGAEIHSEKNITKEGDKELRLIADDWEPLEVSLVYVPADRKSIIRSKDKSMSDKSQLTLSDEQFSLLLTNLKEEFSKRLTREKHEDEEEEEEEASEEEDRMGKKEKREEAEKEEEEEEEADDEEERMGKKEKSMKKKEKNMEEDEEGMEPEDVGEVATQIVDALVEAMPDVLDEEMESDVQEVVEEVLDEASDGEMPEEKVDTLSNQIRKKLKRELYHKVKRSIPKRRKNVKVSVNSDYRANNKKKMLRNMSDSLANKFTKGMYARHQDSGKKSRDITEDNPFMGMKLSQMARELLAFHGKHEESRRLTNSQLYDRYIAGSSRFEKRAGGGPIAVSSDFANLLTNTMTKSVLASYETMRGEQTFEPFVTRNTVENFKQQDRVSVGESGNLKEVAPGADAEIYSISDSKESYQIKTYSKIFQLTRQGFIDDDTGQLQTVLTSGKSAADLESDLVYEQLTSGTVGGASWFSTANKNVASGANTALGHNSFTGIQKIYELLALQTGLDVDTPLGLTMQYLVVPTVLNFQALQTQQVQYPDSVEKPNPFASMYNIIVEPRLDAFSKTAYYGISKQAKSFRTFIELGSLGGQPIMKYEEKFSNDVLCWKLTHDVGAKMLDYKVAVRVAGV